MSSWWAFMCHCAQKLVWFNISIVLYNLFVYWFAEQWLESFYIVFFLRSIECSDKQRKSNQTIRNVEIFYHVLFECHLHDECWVNYELAIRNYQNTTNSVCRLELLTGGASFLYCCCFIKAMTFKVNNSSYMFYRP